MWGYKFYRLCFAKLSLSAIPFKACCVVFGTMSLNEVMPPMDDSDRYTKIDHAELDSTPVSETTLLERRLQNAVKDEKYEEAALIRDKLNQLKSGD